MSETWVVAVEERVPIDSPPFVRQMTIYAEFGKHGHVRFVNRPAAATHFGDKADALAAAAAIQDKNPAAVRWEGDGEVVGGD